MKVGFIGAGKVGFALGKYFALSSVDVTGYYSRSPLSAREAADFTQTRHYGSIEQVLAASDLLFLAVPDSAISQVWDALKTMPVQDKIICHCSGALSSKVFDGIESRRAHGYSLHPFLAVSSKHNSHNDIARAFFTLEGSETRLQEVKRFIENLGNRVCVIEAAQKTKYHAAAVFLSNHVVALADIGGNLLRECGFDEELVSAALGTLLLVNSKKIAESGAVKALTGPVERNDLSTIQKHVACLDAKERQLYIALSARLIKIAKEKHGDYDYLAMETFIKSEMECKE